MLWAGQRWSFILIIFCRVGSRQLLSSWTIFQIETELFISIDKSSGHARTDKTMAPVAASNQPAAAVQFHCFMSGRQWLGWPGGCGVARPGETWPAPARQFANVMGTRRIISQATHRPAPAAPPRAPARAAHLCSLSHRRAARPSERDQVKPWQLNCYVAGTRVIQFWHLNYRYSEKVSIYYHFIFCDKVSQF